MKIVLLTREYPPETTWGGCAIVNYNLARALAAKGHEVHVICQGVDKEYDRKEEGIYVHRVGTDTRGYSMIARGRYMIASWHKLQELYKTGKVDIIQADHWSGEGIICALRKKSALIIKTQNIGPGTILRVKNYTCLKDHIGLLGLSWLTNFTSKRADRFIAESKLDLTEVTKGLNINPEKVDLVYNGIDTKQYRYMTPNARAALGLLDDIQLVLIIGRLERKKGIDVLMNAIPLVLDKKSDTKFLFIGRDSETAPDGKSFKRWMELQAESQGFVDNLIFKGFVQPVELPPFYSACDVFVLSSREESFGLVVAEAMACERPVVATPVGIVPELSQEGVRGLEMVPVENPKELANGILKMLSLTTEEKEHIARENRNIVEIKFSFDSWTGKIIRVYEDALKTKRKCGKSVIVEDGSKSSGGEFS